MDTRAPAPPEAPSVPTASDPRPQWYGGLAGAIAAAAALGVTELVAGLWRAESSLLVAVGDVVIDFAPPSVEDTAISLFGTNDKRALVIGIVVLSLAFGWVLGTVWRRNRVAAIAGFYAFGAVGALAAIRSPFLSAAFGVVAALLAASTGAGVLAFLSGSGGGTAPEVPAAGLDRRRFLVGAGAVAALTALAVAGGRWLTARARRVVAADRADVALPQIGDPVARPSAAASFDVTGISPVVTPNDEFYRIDTALVVPRVDVQDWELAITGMVDRPFTLNYSQLLDLPLEERYVTIACVSNRVGGDLIGNAAWLGVPLAEVLDRAGVQSGASQIVGRSVDGFTVGFPTEVALDGREALIAVGMNGEPLPFEHGFPARLIVAGLYGYVSATKWLSEIELTTLDGFDAYWIPRGWAKEAPIKTQSRIDVPRSGSTVDAGQAVIAGVAWAPTRGIDRVELWIDDGPWQEAELSEPLTADSWVQWRLQWEATPGTHLVAVRATDGTGEAQTAEVAPPRPDGATGYHTVEIQVREA